jgi:hypothetical protein
MTVAAFDAELYLRRLGEDQLIRDAVSSVPRSRILDQAAAALVAADVIDESTAAV